MVGSLCLVVLLVAIPESVQEMVRVPLHTLRPWVMELLTEVMGRGNPKAMGSHRSALYLEVVPVGHQAPRVPVLEVERLHLRPLPRSLLKPMCWSV